MNQEILTTQKAAELNKETFSSQKRFRNPIKRTEPMNKTKLEILQASYWEHFKYDKDLALILPIEHPKRKRRSAIKNNREFRRVVADALADKSSCDCASCSPKPLKRTDIN